MKKETTIKIIIIIVLIIILGILLFITANTQNRTDERQMERGNPMEETTQKETTADSIDEGEIVTEENIDLSNYSSNITIKNAGTYTLTGEFDYAVLINADDEVILNLNDVTIQSNSTAAIANISTNDLTINLLENTTNTLSDGGSSEYDGCIYSLGNLTIEGSGTLNVYGNQEEGEGIATETKDITINGGIINIESEDDGINAGGDGGLITINDGTIYINASGDGIDSNQNLIINGGYIYTMGSSVGGDSGIDTDDGYEINGGTVIALGSDMLELPESTSTQKSVSIDLNTTISEGSNISLIDETGEEIIEFTADQDFSTLIISDSKIESGTYYIYIDGEEFDSVTVS